MRFYSNSNNRGHAARHVCNTVRLAEVTQRTRNEAAALSAEGARLRITCLFIIAAKTIERTEIK